MYSVLWNYSIVAITDIGLAVVNVKTVFLSSLITESAHNLCKTTSFRATVSCTGSSSGSDGSCQIHVLGSVPGKTCYKSLSNSWYSFGTPHVSLPFMKVILLISTSQAVTRHTVRSSFTALLSNQVVLTI